ELAALAAGPRGATFGGQPPLRGVAARPAAARGVSFGAGADGAATQRDELPDGPPLPRATPPGGRHVHWRPTGHLGGPHTRRPGPTPPGGSIRRRDRRRAPPRAGDCGGDRRRPALLPALAPDPPRRTGAPPCQRQGRVAVGITEQTRLPA